MPIQKGLLLNVRRTQYTLYGGRHTHRSTTVVQRVRRAWYTYSNIKKRV